MVCVVGDRVLACWFPVSLVQVPFICDLKPSGKYVMEDMHKVGNKPRTGLKAKASWSVWPGCLPYL
jgi:hypothetical protein